LYLPRETNGDDVYAVGPGIPGPKDSDKADSASEVQHVAPELLDWETRDGDFEPASEADQNRLLTEYDAKLKTGSIALGPVGKPHPFQSKHLNHDLRRMTRQLERQLLSEGTKASRRLHYFTSAAGLWSRGGGVCKALIPYNLKACLEEGDEAVLRKAAEIMKAKTNHDVLFWENAPVPDGEGTYEDREAAVAQAIVDKQKEIIRQIVTRASMKPHAINALDLKFALGATGSAIAQTYVPMTIWTSDQTQHDVYDFREAVEVSFRNKDFPISNRNRDRLMGSVQDFWSGARAAKDRHILAYQRGFHGLDPSKARFIQNTPLIGEGAGRWLTRLTDTGRLLQLGASKTLHQFENIEVVGDRRLCVGAHVLAQRALHKELERDYDEASQMSVILSPIPSIGGTPYMVEKKNRRMRREVHEQSALTKELRDQPAEFLNSNTVFCEGIKENSEPGWELKNQGTEVRVKVNVADPTHEYDAAMICGRLGHEYEDFKWIDDYLDKGEAYLAMVGKILERECEHLRHVPKSSITDQVDWR
jgi:hypothetical protein